jgi:P4 family phage/plasmid primase-like protien
MSASSLANFCDKHNILWFPISLTINADKTKILNSIQHPLYNGRPKMTDFKDLDNSIIKQRQELMRDPYWAKILNTIAIDTSQIYHIDIDTPNYDEGFDKIAETTPYFKSMTKEYGKHILITANNFTPETKRMQFKSEGVELLCGQWSYAPLELYNADKPIIELDNIDTMLVMKDKKPNKIKDVTDDEMSVITMEQNNTHDMTDIEYLLMECIQESLCGDGKQTEWSNVGQAIKNELRDEGIVLFLDWTKKFGTENKKKEAYKHYTKNLKYIALKDKKRLSVASLHYWAKQNNEIAYNLRFSKKIDYEVNMDIEGLLEEPSDYDFAKYFTKINGNNFKCVDVKDKTFYVFNEKNLWIPEKSAVTVRETISNGFYNVFEEYNNKLNTELQKYDPTSPQYSAFSKKTKTLKDLKLKLKNRMNKNNITNDICDILFDEDFDKDMNREKYALPIKGNKMLNMKTLEVYDRTINNKFSYECDADYIELSAEQENDINQYFLDLFCGKQDMVDCVVDIIKSIFSGDKLRYIFFFTGNGCNGKSLLFKLLDSIFKNAMNTIATNVILDFKQNNSITTEFEKLDKCRLGYVTELKEDDKLNEKVIKQISGGDKIDLRALFKTNTTVEPTANLCVLTNELPSFKKEKAIVDRIITIPFLNTFTVDSSFEGSMLSKKDEIFSFIMKRGIIRDKFNLTEEMIAAKEDYIDNNEKVDHLEDFIKERFDIVTFVKTEKMLNNDFVSMYLDWLQAYKRKDDKTSNKLITKRIKQFGIESKESNGNTWYRGLIKKEIIDEDEE